MSQHKALAVLLERPFKGNLALNNPSVRWLASQKHYDWRFWMRGSFESEEVKSFPPFSGTLGFLKEFLFSGTKRKFYLARFREIRVDAQEYDLVWIRGPSLVPLLSLGFFIGLKPKGVVCIHVCANRMTIPYLLTHPSSLNLIRLFFGYALVIIYRLMQARGVNFFYTGEHVKKNFYLKHARYLIDFSDTMLEGGLLDCSSNVKAVCVGRIDKFNNSQEMLRFAATTGLDIDFFGPGVLDPHCFRVEKSSHCGPLPPELVAPTIAKYSVSICITEEYYEGFPRVIAESAMLGRVLVVSRLSAFIEDIISYPKLLVSEDIKSKEDFFRLYNTVSNIGEDILKPFQSWLKERSNIEI